MSDADLSEIRSGRLKELQRQVDSQGNLHRGDAAQEGQRQQEAEARSSILSQILLPEAADRLGRIRLVKESRATEVEDHLIRLARSGQLRSRITEDQLKDLLAAESKHEKGEDMRQKIVVRRRKGSWDDDDDELLI